MNVPTNNNDDADSIREDDLRNEVLESYKKG